MKPSFRHTCFLASILTIGISAVDFTRRWAGHESWETSADRWRWRQERGAKSSGHAVVDLRLSRVREAPEATGSRSSCNGVRGTHRFDGEGAGSAIPA